MGTEFGLQDAAVGEQHGEHAAGYDGKVFMVRERSVDDGL